MKFLPTIAALTLLAAALAACGGDEAPAPEPPTQPAPAAAPSAPKRVAPERATPPATPRGHCRLTVLVTRDGRPARARLVRTEPPDAATTGTDPSPFSDDLRLTPPVEVPADASVPGRFVADGLAAGVYAIDATAVDATAADGAAAHAEVQFRADGDREIVSLHLEPESPRVTLRGRVVGPDGAPIHAFVARAVPGVRWGTTIDDDWHETGDDGTFALSVPDRSRVGVAALVPGRLRVHGPAVFVPVPGEYVLDLSALLEPVVVHVFDEATHAPVPGAAVGGMTADRTSVALERTDAEGRCTLRFAVGERTVKVAAPGYPPVDDLTLRPDERTVEVPLRAGPTLRVRVVRADDGTPVAGVPVYVHTFGADGVTNWRRPPPSRSGPDGWTTFTSVRPEDVLVFAMGNGWYAEGLDVGRVVGDASSTNNWRPRRAPISLPASGVAATEVRVVPAATVSGRVLRHDGTPAAGAIVRARPTSSLAYLGHTEGSDFGSFPDEVAATGADGSFRIDGLFPPARYRLVASAEGEPGEPSAEVAASAPGDVVLRFAAPHFVDVQVADDTSGAPVAGADVACVVHPDRDGWGSRDRVASAITDVSGAARLGPVVAGRFDATASAPGRLESAPLTFDVADDAPPARRLEIRLAASARIRGRVTLPEGLAPESGMAEVVHDDPDGTRRGVEWSRDAKHESAIGPDGAFEIAGVAPGAHLVHATAESGGRHFDGQAQAETGDALAVVSLAPADDPEERDADRTPTFRVRVVDPDGVPVGQASIVASWTDEGLSQQTTFGVLRGDAWIPRASRGTAITVSNAQSLNGIRLGAGTLRATLPKEAEDGYELRLPPGVSIAGRVVDDAGLPVAGVPVRAFGHKSPDEPFAWSRDDMLASAVSAADGAFELRGLDRAQYEVAVEAPFDREPPDDQVVTGGATGVVVRLVRGTPPVVVVVDPDGRPVPDARVEVSKLEMGHDDDLASAETGPDGRATLPALVQGRRVRLSVRSWSHGLDSWDEEWTPAPETVVRMKRLGTVSGRVLLPDGTPAAGVSVWCREVSLQPYVDAWDRTVAGADGAFAIDGRRAASVDLVAGDWERSEGSAQWAPRLEAEPGLVDAAATRVACGATDVVLRIPAERIVRVRLVGLRAPLAAADLPRLNREGESYALHSVATPDPSVFLFTGAVPGRDLTVAVRVPVQNVVGRLTGVRAGQSVELTVEPGTTLEGLVVLPDGADWDSLGVSFVGGGFSVSYESGKDARVLIPCLPRIEGDLHVWTYPQCPPERPGYGAKIRATPGTPVEIRLSRSQ